MIDSAGVEILLVEDNRYDAEMAIRALKKNNIFSELLWVKDGEEALDFLYKKGNFTEIDNSSLKIILLDLKLPKVDGKEVLQVIKNDLEKIKIPVVMLTSSNEEKDILDCYKLGANSYILKTVDFDEFVQVIAEIASYWLILNELPTGELNTF